MLEAAKWWLEFNPPPAGFQDSKWAWAWVEMPFGENKIKELAANMMTHGAMYLAGKYANHPLVSTAREVVRIVRKSQDKTGGFK